MNEACVQVWEAEGKKEEAISVLIEGRDLLSEPAGKLPENEPTAVLAFLVNTYNVQVTDLHF